MGKADDRMAWLRAQREADYRQGRLGPRVAKPVNKPPVNKAVNKAVNKPPVNTVNKPQDRAAYMREYMRRRRDQDEGP
jgi:hypothetical protein